MTHDEAIKTIREALEDIKRTPHHPDYDEYTHDTVCNALAALDSLTVEPSEEFVDPYAMHICGTCNSKDGEECTSRNCHLNNMWQPKHAWTSADAEMFAGRLIHEYHNVKVPESYSPARHHIMAIKLVSTLISDRDARLRKETLIEAEKNAWPMIKKEYELRHEDTECGGDELSEGLDMLRERFRAAFIAELNRAKRQAEPIFDGILAIMGGKK